MVRTVVAMKMRMTFNSFMREKWKIVFFGIAVLYFLGMYTVGVIVLLSMSADTTSAALVFAYSMPLLLVAWILFPIVGYGLDNSLDPKHFAPFTTASRRLAHALIAATALGPGGIVTFLLLLLPTFAYLAQGELVASALGILAALGGTYLLATVGRWSSTSLGRWAASSQTRRDLTAVISTVAFVTIAVCSGVLMPVIFSLDFASFAAAFEFLKWTPLLTPTSLGALALTQQWAALALQLLYFVALLAVLLFAWQRALHPAMVGSPSPVTDAAEAAIVRGDHVVDPARASASAASTDASSALRELPLVGFWRRLGASIPTSAIAGRTLYTWIHDPRLFASGALFLLYPALGAVMGYLDNDRLNHTSLFLFAITPLMLGLTVGQTVSYDSTAFWTHVSAGVRGRQDRWGRFLGSLPASILTLTVTAILGIVFVPIERPYLTIPALLVSIFFIGTGLAFAISGRFTMGVQPPGTSPLSTKGNGNNLMNVVFLLALIAATIILSAPATILIIVYGIHGAVGTALGVGVMIWGFLIFLVGMAVGAKVYDRGNVKLLALIRSWPGH